NVGHVAGGGAASDQHAIGGERTQALLPTGLADVLDHHVHAFGREVFHGARNRTRGIVVVHDRIGAEGARQIELGGAAGGGDDAAAEELGNLNGGHADAAGGGPHQHGLPG